MGTDGFFQVFDIEEGKQYSKEENIFITGTGKLEINKDYFPLAYSSNSSIKGIASLNLFERDEPELRD